MADFNFEVAISGVSGVFPESDGLDELERNLLNKVNMVTTDDRKWIPGELNVPAGTGKVKHPHSFDMTFFGIHRKLCEIMDPHTRLCLEHSYAAICDAGINPSLLSGTNTAVVMGSVISETEYECVMGAKNIGHAMLGHSRTMQANRLSYFMNLKGPSLALDCSWNGGMQALQIGYNMIKSGQICSALVGVCSLISKPEVSTHFHNKGELNRDGLTKSLSADADGYSRSEACVVFFLQRKDFALRLYGTILGVKSNNYGSRVLPYTEMDQGKFKELMEEVVKEAKVNVNDIAFVEAHGMASRIADARELNAVADVFCKNRTKPLPIGCVKSNLGHTEASSSLVSVCKALLALRSGVISPNINYTSPNPDVPSLLGGQMYVVTEPTPIDGDIVGVSSSGIAGAYGHVLIKGNPKKKSKPLKKGELPPDGLPRLVVLSGRDEPALKDVITNIESSPIDIEFVALTHSLFSSEIKKHMFRAYTLLGDGSKAYNQIKTFDSGKKRPVWFVFSGMGSQWNGMGTNLLKIPTFAKAIKRCHEVLKPEGVDLIEIITSQDPKMFDNILHSFVGIAAVQIGLVDILKELGIEPDGIVGHSVGELGCAYADGCFTLEQMILAAYARGRASIETKLIKGKMAAVGMGYNQIKNQLPPSIEVACHNSSESCTLSGPSDDMEVYINELKSKGVFAKLVNVSNIAYHSKHIKPAAPALLKYLKKVVPDPKPRSKRWVSSSILEADWGSELARCSSAEYHTNNLLSSVLFEEASSHIPDDAIVIEIAPHGLLQAILKKSLSTCSNVPLTSRFESDNVSFLLSAIGKLYLEGIDVNLANLYPAVEFPVSRDTDYVSKTITWDHHEEWIIWSFINRNDLGTLPCWNFENISLLDEKFQIFSQNRIHEKVVMPTSSYINFIVNMFSELNKKETNTPLKFEKLKFKKLIEVPSNATKELYFLLQKGSGDFEICEGEEQIAAGNITILDDTTRLNKNVTEEVDESYVTIGQNEFYRFFAHMGVDQGDKFKTVKQFNFNEYGFIADITWEGNWTTFLDGIFNTVSFFEINNSNSLKLVSDINQLSIAYESFPSNVTKEIKVYYNNVTKILKCYGLEMLYPEVKEPYIAPSEAKILMEHYKLIPYSNANVKSVRDIVSISAHVVFKELNRFQDGGITQLNVIDIRGNGLFTDNILCVLERPLNVDVSIKQCEGDSMISSFDWNELTKEAVWAITDNPAYKKTIKLLKTAKQSFILTKANDEIISYAKNYDLKLIFDFVYNNEKILLFKHEKTCFDQKIVVELKGDWSKDLQMKLKNEAGRKTPSKIYAVASVSYISEINEIVEECSSLEHSDLLRLYVLDGKCPKFDVTNKFYQPQIMKDLKINVCLDNTWGVVSLVSIEKKTEKKPIELFGKNVFQLSSFKCDDVQLSSVCLNLEDVTGSSKSSRFSVLEYCGLDKNKEKVFGVASVDEGNILIPDKTLVWKKPSSWSDEEATTVPLFYSMAYHIILSCNEMLEYSSILVHRGSLPVSQAILNVATAKGFNIFVTYKNEDEKNFIKRNYPKIPDDQIMSCRTKQYFVDLMLKTKGLGVDIVVNTLLEADMIRPSQKCIGSQGSYFQISLDPMEDKAQMGMSILIIEAMVNGMLPQKVLEMQDYYKQKVQQGMAQGIQKGEIKPLKIKKLSNDLLNTTAISLLKSSGNLSNKMVVVLDQKLTRSDLFLCDGSKTYLILGGQQSWLELVEWLVARGAKNINIVLKQHILSGFTAQKMNAIFNIYPTINVNFMSIKRISSKTNIENLINEITSGKELASVFIIGNGLKDKIVSLDQVLREKNQKCQIVCIGEGGETVCERRRDKDLPAVSISCSSNLSPKCIIPSLDWLTSESNVSPVVVIKEAKNLKSSDIEMRNLSYKNHVPENLKELLEFQKSKSDRGHFVEIKTACPEYKYAKELPPVFIFSGLKPNQLKELTMRLFHPAFEAVLPVAFPSIEAVAQELYTNMVKFPHNVFTLIADDWGTALALKVATLLEADDKYVSVIMIDASPRTVQEWTKTIYDANGLKMISKYLKFPPDVKKTLTLMPNFNEMLDVALNNTILTEDKDRIREAIVMLRNRLDAITKFSAFDTKVHGKCHLIRASGSSNDQCGLEMFCKRMVKIHLLDVASHKEVITSEETARTINSHVLFEYRDAANKPDEDMIGMNITHDIKHKATGLLRA